MRRFSTVPFKGTKEQEAELVAWQYAGQTSGGNLWNFHVLFAVQPLSEG